MAQKWDPEQYEREGGFVADYGREVAAMLAPRPGERILDLGCGDGRLSELLAGSGCRLVAVDSSPEQVRAAAGRGLDARVIDAARLPFREEFDAVFSNAALHWIRPPEAVVRGVFAALRPGGRFVGELGGSGNIDSIRGALAAALPAHGLDFDALDPWYFPGEKQYSRLLQAAGFAVDRIELFDRPTPLPGDISGWLRTFTKGFLEQIPEAERDRFLDRLAASLEPALRRDHGEWFVDYVRLRFAAAKPA